MLHQAVSSPFPTRPIQYGNYTSPARPTCYASQLLDQRRHTCAVGAAAFTAQHEHGSGREHPKDFCCCEGGHATSLAGPIHADRLHGGRQPGYHLSCKYTPHRYRPSCPAQTTTLTPAIATLSRPHSSHFVLVGADVCVIPVGEYPRPPLICKESLNYCLGPARSNSCPMAEWLAFEKGERQSRSGSPSDCFALPSSCASHNRCASCAINAWWFFSQCIRSLPGCCHSHLSHYLTTGAATRLRCSGLM